MQKHKFCREAESSTYNWIPATRDDESVVPVVSRYFLGLRKRMPICRVDAAPKFKCQWDIRI